MVTGALAGRTALVTGASRGIGYAIAETMSRRGANVVLTSRSEQAAQAAAAAIGGERVLGVCAHATDEVAAAGCVASAVERFGSLDILVNNAGTNPAYGPLLDQDKARVMKTLDVNLWAPVLWSGLAWRVWMRNHGGTIVNTASIGGMLVAAELGAYQVSKAALIHLTRQLAFELAPAVRVNAVAPGVVRTRLAEALWKEDEDATAAGVPLRRIGEPADVASAVAFPSVRRGQLGDRRDAGGRRRPDARGRGGGGGHVRAAGRHRDMSTHTLDVPGVRTDAVTDWLVSVADVHPPIRYRRLGNGQSNLTYLATDSVGHRLVLRRPPLGALLGSAHDVAREHRILRCLATTSVPLPRVVAFTDDPQVTDAPLLAMAFVEGLVLDDLAVAEQLPASTRRRLGLALTAALGAVHATDLEATGLSSLSAHESYAARQLARWRRQWEASRTRELPQLDELADRLESAMPTDNELTLVHGDFHLSNVVAAPDGGMVGAVLDWELAALGDPLADLGGLLAYWSQPGDRGPVLSEAPSLPGFPSRAELVESYAEITGRDVSSVPFWHALALWKLAIIGEGVMRRSRDEPRNAARRELPAQLAEALVDRGRDVARSAGF